MDLQNLILFILPAYFANASPVIFGGGIPLDFRAIFIDGKRLLGDGKTWRGLIAGISVGTLVGASEWRLLSDESYLVAGFLLSLGAMVGDILGSFIKRRLGMKRGHPFFLMDQLPFIIFALLFATPIRVLAWDEFMVVLVITYFLHISSNFLANRLGLKMVPW